MTIEDEKFSTLIACTRMATESNPKEPRVSCATTKDRNGGQKPAKGVVKVINMVCTFVLTLENNKYLPGHNGYKTTGTTAAKLGIIEEALFGQTGWLSPLKTFQVVAYAGTVGHYNEACNGQLFSKGGLDKFKLFEGETDGKELWDVEGPLFAQREKKEGSVPMHLLGLAKQR
ncbi:hypothetical protein CPB85DRAFT_1311113 [Mucidula mucida]|nr:hypothetical protein CPB85DRAFT_549956 [Mucidula mucida]KAF8907566.1 hypothetical protein CPB85DRAFT_1311113 [Mucidula mucida]